MLLLEQKVIDPFVSNVERIVLEAELTADQIKQLFTSIEKDATAAGDNRTAVGKGTDAVKNAAGAIKAEIDKLGSAIKNAGPVQNMDAKFNELKTKIGDKDSKVVSAVKAVSDWAKENPGKASVAVAILTAAAALAGVEEGAEGAEGEDAGDYSKGCQEGETGRGIFTGDFRDDVFDDEGQAGARGGGGEDAREESNRELQTHGLEVGEVGSEAF